MKTLNILAVLITALFLSLAFNYNSYSSQQSNDCKCCGEECSKAGCCTDMNGSAQGEAKCCTDKCTSDKCKESCAGGNCTMMNMKMDMNMDMNKDNMNKDMNSTQTTDNQTKSDCCKDKSGSTDKSKDCCK